MTSVRNGSGAQSSLKRRTAGTVTLRAAAPTNRAMVVAVMVSMVAFLDSTVINLALPATEHDLGGGMALQQRMIDMVILAEVAAHTDDRNLLQQMANDARDAHPIGSPGQRRASAYVLARAAWYRDDIHDAMRWLGDVRLLGTPLSPCLSFTQCDAQNRGWFEWFAHGDHLDIQGADAPYKNPGPAVQVQVHHLFSRRVSFRFPE